MGIDYKAFVNYANTDNRLGPQTFSVTGNTLKTVNWTDSEGNSRPFQVREITGSLVDAGGASIRMDINSMPPAEKVAELEALIKSKARLSQEDHKLAGAIGKISEVTEAIKAATGKSVEDLSFGDEFRVEVVKNKQGYLRVKSVLGGVKDAPDFNAPASGGSGPSFV